MVSFVIQKAQSFNNITRRHRYRHHCKDLFGPLSLVRLTADDETGYFDALIVLDLATIARNLISKTMRPAKIR